MNIKVKRGDSSKSYPTQRKEGTKEETKHKAKGWSKVHHKLGLKEVNTYKGVKITNGQGIPYL